MEINHLHILVNDVATSSRYYQENFSMTQIATTEFGVILRDDSGMDFVIGPAKENELQGQRMHFGFRQTSKAAVKQKFEDFSAQGETFVTPYVENAFVTLFSMQDPDGNLVEIYFADGMS